MSNPFNTPDWSALDQNGRDSAYNNSAAVQNSSALVETWETLSAQLRQDPRATLDLRYGPKERNRFDYLHVKDNGPVLAFIHGGYWQMRSKETFTFCSAGPMAHGINVAHIGYTLAPHATLNEIVAEIHAGVNALVSALPKLGGTADNIMIAGWSAGAHLAAMSLNHPSVKSGLCISGIYDLRHIQQIYVNRALNLADESALRNSPARHPVAPNKPLIVVAGSGELPWMRQQSANFAAHRAQLAVPVVYEEIPDANHFTIMDAMAQPQGRITRLVTALIEAGSI